MPTAVVLQHVAFEDLGLFAPRLRARGYGLQVLQAGVDAPEPLVDADLAVVLGGPLGARPDAEFPWMATELEALTRRVQARRPTLGICLGAQLMAAALGASVEPMGVKEIGYAPLTLTREGADSPLSVLGSAPVLHWHGDRFGLPDGAELLAFTPTCDHQAFRLGPNLLGLQFHPEADPAQIERWLIAYDDELNAAGIAPHALRDRARTDGVATARVAPGLVDAWLDQLA
ncbi:glutamine amidotransferase [Propionibacterium freudenreichii]|uniref:glutamine amidotransferase n=1 Tax=Propionibacterium freudenreichii TaxID=1744 RepID=UPI0022FD8FBC|nr:glutamine amidotransferase [Propionibacterium freudenreichii]